MNREALFSDGTEDYVDPPQPQKNESVTLRFRTRKEDADAVKLITDTGEYPLEKKGASGDFDYYEIQQSLGEAPFCYAFQVLAEKESCYYNMEGCFEKENYRVGEDPFAFRIVPGFSTPDWAKGAVMYQIFVDRFCNGDPDNDVEDQEYVYIGTPVCRVKDWQELPQSPDVHRFYGGDLEGVRQKLDYLQELGVEGIYFNPLFVSPSNHKYDSQDYDYIDPHFGKIAEDGDYRKRVCSKANLEAGNQLFAELVQEMHERGMRVILDGVFNHCGSFHKWMDRERIYEGDGNYPPGAYVRRGSPYHTYFRFWEDKEEAWPYNGKYEGWWGYDTLPKLNYEESPKLEEEILRIGRKWVSEPYCADGWRLDVAADLGHSDTFNHQFWARFRSAVKEANPEALILAEHYGDPGMWLQGDQWDTVMNYDGFMEPVTWFLTGMEKHSDERREDLRGNADVFVAAVKRFKSRMLMPSWQVAMNELSNHDHSRFLTRTNQMVGRIESVGAERAEQGVQPSVMRLAVVLQMTMEGMPTVYYGDEAGLCGFTDPDSRRTYPWGREDQSLLECHRILIGLRRREKALRTGSWLMLYQEKHVLVYGRFTKEEQLIVALNGGEERKETEVPVWRAGVQKDGRLKRLFCSYENGYSTEYDEYRLENGSLSLNLGAHSAIILKHTEEDGKGKEISIYFGA